VTLRVVALEVAIVFALLSAVAAGVRLRLVTAPVPRFER